MDLVMFVRPSISMHSHAQPNHLTPHIFHILPTPPLYYILCLFSQEVNLRGAVNWLLQTIMLCITSVLSYQQKIDLG